MMETIGKFFAGLIMIILSVLVSAFIFMKVWGWFIAPVFDMLPILTYFQSVGIVTFLATMRKAESKKQKDFEDLIEEFIAALIYSGIVFVFAWVIYFLIK